MILFALLQTSCTSYTYKDLVHEGLVRSEVLTTSYFQHRLLRKSSAINQQGSALRLYIEGDGRPWRRRNLVAADPSSPDSMMLRAMLMDEHQAVYIGRPCYLQVEDPRCSAEWWTFQRYHPEVVASLGEVVERIAADHQELWLIGHSGGGSLAVLLGRRLSRPVKVVTVAANLDHRAWTRHHGYSDLTGSLNPIDDRSNNPAMRELHWYGSADRNVLPAWTLAYCQQHEVPCRAFTGGHDEGWLEDWPRLLRRSAATWQGREAPLKATGAGPGDSTP